jgi:nucleotide sugar dehydrogenase
MSEIAVVGLGAIGLPIATIFGLHFDVIGIDIDKKKVDGINKKTYWGGLERKIKEILPKSKIKASTNLGDIKNVNFIILTLPTDDGDLVLIEKTLSKISKFFTKDVIISSTIRPGFTREMQNKFKDIIISHVPVRTFEGKAVDQFCSFPQLIGTFDNDTYERVSKIYKRCGCTTIPAIPPEKAELSKLFSNAYRQVQMGIANELAFIAKTYGFDPEEIFELVNRGDPYRDIKTPGIWGGYCLPKDTKLLIECMKKEHGYTPEILLSSEKIRLKTIERKVDEILSYGKNITVGIEGITSKPIEAKVPDVRGSPVLSIIKMLTKNGLKVKIFDPNLAKNQIEKIAKLLGVEIGSRREVMNCDVYAVHENYDLRIKKVKTN